MTNQASEDELRKWWWACNGTGTDAFSKCRNNTICSWHGARLDELSDLIRTEKLKLLDEVIHQSTVNLKSAKAVAGWAELRKEQLEAEL